MGRRSHLLLLGVLLLAQLVLLSTQVRSGRMAAVPGDPVLSLLGPAAQALTGTIEGVSGIWSGYLDLRGAHLRSQAMEDEVRHLRIELEAREELERENRRLAQLLRLRERRGWGPAVGARVVALNRTAASCTLLLDRGGRQGLRTDQAVLTPDGLVGRVIAVGPGTAKVQMLTDPSAAVAVYFERSREQATGIAGGGRGRTLEVRYVADLADVRPGDLARTSGLDGIYPKGLPVGTVERVRDRADLTKEIDLAPSAALGRLEEVLVLLEIPEIRPPQPPVEDDPLPDGPEASLAHR